MIKNYCFEIVEDNICISRPTLFCISRSESTEKIYILRSDSLYNPCDYVENLFNLAKEKNLNIKDLFIDLRNYFVGYNESWLWKCSFIEDENCDFDDVMLQEIMDTQLLGFESEFLKEYLYSYIADNELSVCY